jgi:hypothetical protein
MSAVLRKPTLGRRAIFNAMGQWQTSGDEKQKGAALSSGPFKYYSVVSLGGSEAHSFAFLAAREKSDHAKSAREEREGGGKWCYGRRELH